MHYVYVLKCANGTIYTGCTNNIEDRLKRHSSGRVLSTKDRLPVSLVCYTVFENKYIAYNFEKYLKSGSGRAFLSKHLT